MDYRHVPPDPSLLSVYGRGRRAGAVAIARHRADLRPHAAAAVLLFQPGGRRQPDLRLVLERGDLEASTDHALGVGSRLCDRLARRRYGRLLVRAPAAGGGDLRSLCEDGQRTAARRSGADFYAVAWA